MVLLIATTGAADMAMALEVRLTGQAEYTVSDNIHRAPVGTEVSGTIWNRTVGLEVNETWGPNTLDLHVRGGWESVDGTTKTDDEVSRIMLNTNFPLVVHWSYWTVC